MTRGVSAARVHRRQLGTVPSWFEGHDGQTGCPDAIFSFAGYHVEFQQTSLFPPVRDSGRWWLGMSEEGDGSVRPRITCRRM